MVQDLEITTKERKRNREDEDIVELPGHVLLLSRPGRRAPLLL